MKFLTSIILTALLSYAIGLFTFLPWFSFVFCALIVAVFVHQQPLLAFIAGFISIFILWFVLAFLLSNANEHLLAKKVASILPVGGNHILLILITAFLGALLAGMAALTGSYLRKKPKM